MRRLPIVVLALGAFFVACGSGGTETTDTPTPWPTPSLTVERIEEFATENAEQTLRQMVSFSTTIEEMLASDASALLEDLGVGHLTVVEEKQTCPPGAWRCGGAPAFAADEVGYLWMARGLAIDYQGGSKPIPDIVAWAWVSETAWVQGGGLVDVD